MKKVRVKDIGLGLGLGLSGGGVFWLGLSTKDPRLVFCTDILAIKNINNRFYHLCLLSK